MKLCQIVNFDSAGRLYIPKQLLKASKVQITDALYAVVDEETQSIVIAKKEYFEK